MLFIYYLSDGEIKRAARPEKSLEEYYGRRAEEMSRVYGALYIETYTDFVFNNFDKFRVVDGKLEFIDKNSLSFLRNL